MLIVEDNIIYITQGDDAVMDVEINTTDGQYTLQPGDRLTLTVRAEPSPTSPVLMSTGSATRRIPIRHDDTKDMNPGEYSADVELLTADGKRITVWPTLVKRRTAIRNWNNFNVMPEVTTNEYQ